MRRLHRSLCIGKMMELYPQEDGSIRVAYEWGGVELGGLSGAGMVSEKHL